MNIPIIKIRRSWDRLIFIMEIPYIGERRSLYWTRPLVYLPTFVHRCVKLRVQCERHNMFTPGNWLAPIQYVILPDHQRERLRPIRFKVLKVNDVWFVSVNSFAIIWLGLYWWHSLTILAECLCWKEAVRISWHFMKGGRGFSIWPDLWNAKSVIQLNGILTGVYIARECF